MKKLLFVLLVWVYPILSFSAINDCKTDIYYANGILTKGEDALAAVTDVLEPAIKKLYTSEIEMKKYIGKVAYTYNSTHLWGIDDLFESLMQKLSLAEPLDEAEKAFMLYLVKTAHEADLDAQVKKYKSSIENGHKVLVIAH